MSHDIFKPSNLIGCLENKTADSAQTRKRAIVTRPFSSPGGRGLGTRLHPFRLRNQSAVHGRFMSHDIFKPSNLIGCLENKTADSAQTRKRAIVTRPFPSPGGRGLGTRLRIRPLRVRRSHPLISDL